ncbi:acyl-CoA dehydrogenase family protein [Cupriavidus neocaledonicus]|uniref:Acyl-CoA dehydrogenase, C-terminal:Acyl-CoA dehydrogenase, central region n=1 Tax=Cupriavidus neocaledonicus TaxID=1040979 RepID=A0A375HMP0_9BURK|nr:acyl-CoA dehydrogenase [Cupriavidus neocaledonicus]SOZ39187.1 Acyl-CoA dehydrogenase, C-terminal:Acyl-CoA dehydrogenase, central region [Cupriavidus neocaledonicus]SPD59142.1 Acyl-CoA dehydrogenase, C-terminal:Acyl-CoA dehydrogenase, central region [Cupriavidus neocaledonicus]
MDFSLNDEHIALRDAVRRFCDGEYPAHRRGDAESDGEAAARWSAMAELGLLGLPLAADVGGSEQGPTEVMLVAQELGRALGGGAWLSSVVLAGQLLDEAGTPAQRQQWLPALAAGQARLALAIGEADARYDLSRVSTRARAHGDGWVLAGAKTLVLDGARADAFIVAARTAGDVADEAGITLFLVPAGTPGVSVREFPTLDGRSAAHLALREVALGADAVVGQTGGALPAIITTADRANAVLCAEAVGALEALLDLTADQLNTRRQFGSLLAKFQVLQHRVADMLIALEQCKSMACVAAMAVADGDPVQRRRLVSAAKTVIGQAGRQVGQWAIQMHGAMGMTDECRVGHYAKRLMVINQLFGDAGYHLACFARQA